MKKTADFCAKALDIPHPRLIIDSRTSRVVALYRISKGTPTFLTEAPCTGAGTAHPFARTLPAAAWKFIPKTVNPSCKCHYYYQEDNKTVGGH